MAARTTVILRHLDPGGHRAACSQEVAGSRAGLPAAAACASRCDLGHGLSAHVYDCPACGARNAADVSLGLVRGSPYRHWQCHFCAQKVCLKDPAVHYADVLLSLPASLVPFLGPLNDLRRGLTEGRRSLVTKALLGLAGDVAAAVAFTPAQQVASSVLERCCDGTGAALECREALAGGDSLGAAISASIAALHLLGAGLEVKASAAVSAMRATRQVAMAARARVAGLASRRARAAAVARAGSKPVKLAKLAAGGGFYRRRLLARQAVARLLHAALARAAAASQSAAAAAQGARSRLASLRSGAFLVSWLCDSVDVGGTALQEALQFFESINLFGDQQEASRRNGSWEQLTRCPSAIASDKKKSAKAGAPQQSNVLEMEKALQTLSRSCSLTGVRLEGFAEAAQELYRAMPTVIVQRSNL